MRTVLAACALAIATPALAAAPQPFVSFTVTAEDWQRLSEVLSRSLPPAYSAPVVQWAQDLEARAVADKEIADLKAQLERRGKK